MYKHKAHRHTYNKEYETVSRARCEGWGTDMRGVWTCLRLVCPQHYPKNYAERMAKHAAVYTNGIRQ